MNKIEKYKIARAVVASHTHACVREGEKKSQSVPERKIKVIENRET